MKELFPLNTFQQDAVLKRMNELTNEIKDIEDGEVELPNAKPIYFHPIRFDINGATAGQVMYVRSGSIMILNNDATSIDTFKKLRDYLYNNGDEIDILCSIDIFDANGYAGQILSITGGGTDESPVISVVFTSNGQATTDGALGASEFIVVSDKVNKIN